MKTMVGVIFAAVAGAAVTVGYLAYKGIDLKKVVGDNKSKINPLQDELNRVSEEANKYKARCRDLEIKNEELTSALTLARKKSTLMDDTTDDLQDDLKSAERKIKKLQEEKDALSKEIREYQSAVESLKIELSNKN